jgi:hypothetical protein
MPGVTVSHLPGELGDDGPIGLLDVVDGAGAARRVRKQTDNRPGELVGLPADARAFLGLAKAQGLGN